MYTAKVDIASIDDDRSDLSRLSQTALFELIEDEIEEHGEASKTSI